MSKLGNVTQWRSTRLPHMKLWALSTTISTNILIAWVVTLYENSSNSILMHIYIGIVIPNKVKNE